MDNNGIVALMAWIHHIFLSEQNLFIQKNLSSLIINPLAKPHRPYFFKDSW